MNAIPLAPAALTLALLSALGGCEQEASPPSPSTSAPAAAPAPTGMDWSGVAAAQDGSQIMGMKTVSRYADHWYGGTKDSFELSFDGRGAATDGAGNEVPITAEQWKGIVTDARRATTEKPLVATASKSVIYRNGGAGTPQDSFGTLPRFKYGIDAVDDGTLRFRNLGKLDDGM